MTIKLIALDIDDTLLTSDKTILPSTLEAITKCLAQGIKVVLCTGRPLAGVKLWLDELGIDGPDQYVVTYNGAIIQSTTGAIIAKKLIDNAGYRWLTAFGQANHLPFNVLDAESRIYTADQDVDFVTVVQAMENSAGLSVRQPDELPKDFAITKGLYVGNQAKLDAAEPLVRETFGVAFSVIRAGKNFLEVMPAGVDKGNALKALGDAIRIKPEEMMGFGDEGNDLQMFATVGLAVAMGNGTPIAKAHADFVTATNDDGGIAKAIHQFVLDVKK